MKLNSTTRFKFKILPYAIATVIGLASQYSLADGLITEITQPKELPQGDDLFLFVNVSGDGNTVVSSYGKVYPDADEPIASAFSWTPSQGIVDLGGLEPAPYFSIANSVNTDGSVIVGESSVTTEVDIIARHAFIWTKQGGMIDIGTLEGIDSTAMDVSGDGSVVVGLSDLPLSERFLTPNHAFRWTQAEGMVDLGTLGGRDSAAFGVSSDGNVVIGLSDTRDSENAHAFRWTASEGMIDLGTLGSDFSFAFSASADGGVIVGWSDNESGVLRAFRWTEPLGMVDLGVLEGHNEAAAIAVNSDGNVIVGVSALSPLSLGDDVTGTAFRWTESEGMQSVLDWLNENSIDTSEITANPIRATDVSDDGNVVVGILENSQIYYARVDEQGSGLITLSDFSNSLASSSEAIASTFRASATLINGAHSHPMSRRVENGQNTFWIAGDLGTDDHQSRDGSFGIAEIGVGHNYGPIQLNVSLGKTWSDQNLMLGGDVESNGTHIMLEGIIPVSEENKLFATVGAFGHWGEADIRRGYLNAGLPDFSTASPDTTTWGVRARMDWVDAWATGEAYFTPYVDISYTDIELDGYTEVGGGFPAMFDKRSEDISELRVGLNASMPINDTDMDLVGGIEATHRFDNNGARTSGELIGLFAFDLDGQEFDSTWYKTGIGVEGKLGEGKASLMLNGTTEGEMPNAWLAASYQMSF